MPAHQPMPLHLETQRLTLRPWAESDVDDYRALAAGVPTVEEIRESIAHQLAATTQTGIALLPMRRRDVGDFIGYCSLIVGRATVDEPEIAYELFRRAHARGDLVWLTRALP